MSDRAPIHITIGGALPRAHLPALARIVADNDLRAEWDGEPLDFGALDPDEPLELYGTEMPGGQVPELDAFCCEHGLPFRRWSGAASAHSCLKSWFLAAATPFANTPRARTSRSCSRRHGSWASPACAT